jgi:hypothetical protein
MKTGIKPEFMPFLFLMKPGILKVFENVVIKSTKPKINHNK